MDFVRTLRQEYKTVINVIVLVALTGLVYIYPFHTNFRFTVSVAVMATLLLYFPRIPAVSTTILCGIAIFVGRGAVQIFFADAEISRIFFANVPAIMYYVAYGVLFQYLGVRKYIDNMPSLILLLSLIDIASNAVELLIRFNSHVGKFETVFTSIIAVAIVRAVLASGGYYLLRRYQAFVLAEDQMARYTQLTMMIAQLKTELFYLNKSSQEIEQVMEDSYWLYKKLHAREQEEPEGDTSAGQALSIARNIHEVKKDYRRVVAGIEAILEPSAEVKGMHLSEVFFIIEQNTLRCLAGTNKKIDLSFDYATDLITEQHYAVVSILDNLITNAIDACGDLGRIRVKQYIEAGNVVFVVEDSGCGVKQEDIDLLYEPGYSTKFCPETGRMSTGLGLAHVKNLAGLLGGTVRAESETGDLTRFVVTLPLFNIVSGKE